MFNTSDFSFLNAYIVYFNILLRQNYVRTYFDRRFPVLS